jgi:serine O-acetyltransferase
MDATEPSSTPEAGSVAGAGEDGPGQEGNRPVTFRDVLRGGDFALSSRRLWLLSVALRRAGHRRTARLVKDVNSILYHNSLSERVELSPDIKLGHHGIGTVIHPKVTIGRNVKIFQNVTIAVRPPTGPGRVIIEDNAAIGANSVVMTRSGDSIRIGFGSRVGAGAVVTRDVPPRMNAISSPAELRPRRNHPSRVASDADARAS